MTYVVSKACLGKKDRSCVEVCPVDCFYDVRDPELNRQYNVAWAQNDEEEENARNAGMLLIHPDECINCGACETECPNDAIFEDSDIPEGEEVFVELNQEVLLAMSDEQLDQARCTSKDG